MNYGVYVLLSLSLSRTFCFESLYFIHRQIAIRAGCSVYNKSLIILTPAMFLIPVNTSAEVTYKQTDDGNVCFFVNYDPNQTLISGRFHLYVFFIF